MTEILRGIVGSTAYGLATPQSDIDRLGVFVAPTRDVLGLNPATVVGKTRTSTKPDVTLHEVGKYLSLALKGNPTILELMWLDTYEVTTLAGEEIIELRHAVLSKRLAKSYGGYVLQQARRLETRWRLGQEGFDSDLARRTPKHGRHCMRLLLQGRQLLGQEHMRVRLYSSEREKCFAAGELADTDPEKFKALIEQEMVKFDRVAEHSGLPEEPDYARVERTLRAIRMAALTGDL